MKKELLLTSLALSVLTGCASTYKVNLTALPDDAAIYIDGEYRGRGDVTLDVGPEHNYPKSYEIKIKRKDYETLKSSISNHIDWNYAFMNAGTLICLSALNIGLGMSRPRDGAGNLLIGLACLPMSVLPFFNSNRFSPAYEFELEPKITSSPSP